MNQKAKQALGNILDLFQSGNVPEALTVSLLPRLDVPSAHWSVTNRLLMFLHNTSDARGFRQWQLVGRQVKSGAKAFYIFCPKTVIKENQEGEKVPMVVGFRAAPVFKIEDTKGKELTVEQLPPPQLPPLYDVAEKWGINVDWQGYPGTSYGYYSPGDKKIVLATHDEEIFFHELAHVAHQKVCGNLSKIEIWRRECVAELTASVLAHIYGKRCNTGRHYQYIRSYASDAGLDAYQACMSVVGDASQCLSMILDDGERPSLAA